MRITESRVLAINTKDPHYLDNGKPFSERMLMMAPRPKLLNRSLWWHFTQTLIRMCFISVASLCTTIYTEKYENFAFALLLCNGLMVAIGILVLIGDFVMTRRWNAERKRVLQKQLQETFDSGRYDDPRTTGPEHFESAGKSS